MTADTTPRAPTAPDSTASSSRWVALAVIAVAQLMVALDATIVNVALPTAQSALGFDDSQRAWVITAYTLSLAGLLLLGGRVADRFGRRRAMLVGLTGFAVSSAIAGAASGFEHARRRPRAPGRERRDDGTRGAVPDRRDVHRSQGARQGVRDLRRDREQRRRHRAAARRRAHRVRRLALVPLRQRRGRRRRHRGRPPGAAVGRRPPHDDRRPLRRTGHRRAGRPGAGLQPGRCPTDGPRPRCWCPR